MCILWKKREFQGVFPVFVTRCVDSILSKPSQYRHIIQTQKHFEILVTWFLLIWLFEQILHIIHFLLSFGKTLMVEPVGKECRVVPVVTMKNAVIKTKVRVWTRPITKIRFLMIRPAWATLDGGTDYFYRNKFEVWRKRLYLKYKIPAWTLTIFSNSFFLIPFSVISLASLYFSNRARIHLLLLVWRRCLKTKPETLTKKGKPRQPWKKCATDFFLPVLPTGPLTFLTPPFF